MSKTDEVRKAMVEAMKAKDKETKDTLSMLLAALKNKAIDKREDLTEEEEVQVVLKEIKQTKESLEMTPADRTDLIEEFKKRIAVLEGFAPKMMDADEIKAIIQSLHEFNPMMGHRGCRLAVTYPEIAKMQTKAVIRAAIEVQRLTLTGMLSPRS